MRSDIIDLIIALSKAGAAAGFGSFTASVSALEPTETPTVVVETSGPNTAKNINLVFALPRGASAYSYADDGNGNISITEAE